MDREKPDCWPIGKAEKHIHAYARATSSLELAYTDHAEEKMAERDISVADIFRVLETGQIYDDPREGTKPGYCKYKICGKTANTRSRQICVVVIPDPHKSAIKVITVMWRDVS